MAQGLTLIFGPKPDYVIVNGYKVEATVFKDRTPPVLDVIIYDYLERKLNVSSLKVGDSTNVADDVVITAYIKRHEGQRYGLSIVGNDSLRILPSRYIIAEKEAVTPARLVYLALQKHFGAPDLFLAATRLRAIAAVRRFIDTQASGKSDELARQILAHIQSHDADWYTFKRAGDMIKLEMQDGGPTQTDEADAGQRPAKRSRVAHIHCAL